MKLYLATAMNGRTIKEIKNKIEDCAAFLVKNEIDFFNPFLETVAKDNVANGIIRDKKPIEMLCDSARHIEECDGVMFIGSRDDLVSSLGCQVEVLIANNYGKGCLMYDGEDVISFKSIETTYEFGEILAKKELGA
ncbi:hypothetical protein Hs30E_15700 [Lactococcus hodotermopsidis]|uniref:Nucleoside 2-deoxyribosyltransferase n=1 Tax=Pseudolactococcus hodotermopsidis TaxID=2709157 RepID=A0A6A0BC94_9LACT|nr:hypothetical protein [Lactococcus hodotermopsidis]GFH43019.1 hypothetical protein Hs30E_15700 [Lactococcus hodotermopsidis]